MFTCNQIISWLIRIEKSSDLHLELENAQTLKELVIAIDRIFVKHIKRLLSAWTEEKSVIMIASKK